MSACGAYGGRLRLRKIPSQLRRNIQDEIATALSHLNVQFRRDLLREVVFSVCDEVRGMFAGAVAYLYYRALSLLVFHVNSSAVWDVVVGTSG